jgi:hypothetical protein
MATTSSLPIGLQTQRAAAAGYWPPLLGVMLLAAVVRLLFANGPLGSDDLVYLARSVEIAQGEWNSANYNGALRYGFNIPAGALLALFGVNLTTANLWPLACSLAEVAAVYVFAWHAFGRREALLAALMLATTPLHIASATRIHADPIVSLFLTLAFVLFFLAERRTSRALFFCAGLSIGMVYWVKELVIVTLFALALYPLVWRRWSWQWLAFVAGGLVMLVGHLALMTAIAGDPLHLVKTVTGQISRSYLGQMDGEDGAFYYFRYLFADVRHTWLAGFFAAAAVLVWLRTRFAGAPAAGPKPGGLAFAVFWLLSLIAVLSFLPVSFSPFRLTMKQSNYLTLFLAPLVVLAAFAVARLSRGWQWAALIAFVGGGLALGALQQQAYRLFTSNSNGAAQFLREHPQARLLGFTNNGNIVQITSILDHEPTLRERFTYLEDVAPAELPALIAAHPDAQWHAVFDRETMNWGGKALRWKAPLACWRRVENLQPAGFGAGRHLPAALLAVAEHLPAALATRLEPPLQRLVAPQPAEVYRIDAADPLCGATPASR